MKKIVLLILVTLTSMVSIKAQYYVKVKGDTTHMEIDSVLLSVDNSYGKVSWQISTDSINWMDLEEGNTHPVWIDSLACYRAIAVNESCPVISDTIEAGVIKTRVGYDFSMDDKGMVYELPSGLNIIVPPNAISGVNSLSIQEFDSIQAKSSLPFPADSGKAFIYAMKFNPANTNLLKPVKIRIPTSKYGRGDLPRIFLFNTETDEWINYTGDILCNRQHKYIEVTLNSLQPFRMDAFPEGLFLTDEKKTQLKSMGKQNNKAGENDPCYDLIRIRSEEIDFTTIHKNQECFFIDETGSVEFLKCPTKPNDYWHIREIGKNCEPKVEVKIDDDPNKEFIKAGDDVVLTFFTYIYAGGKKNPLPDQFISFNLPEGLTSKLNSVWTDNAGTKDLEVTATSENLNGLINFTVHYNYCPELIEASSTNSFEGACQQSNITSDVDGIKRVIVYDDCTDPDALDCSLANNQACQSIKDELPVSISLIPEHQILNFNDEFPLTVIVNNEPHLNNSSLEINWSSSDRTIATVDSQGRVTSNSTEGTVIITASVCELEPATSTIEVQNITCDNAKVTVSPQSVNIAEGGHYPIDIEYGASTNGATYIPVIEFSSINTGIATVDDKGIIHAIKKGNTEVIVSWCEESFFIYVEVKEVDYCDSANVEVNTNPINLSLGDTNRIVINYYETSSGNLYVPIVTFTCTNNSIASVNSNGVVQAISKGEATIIVEWCDTTVNIPVTVEGDPYIISWKATIHDQKVVDLSDDTHIATQTFVYDGIWEGSAEFVKTDVNGSCQVDNSITTVYFNTSILSVTISDCGNEVRNMEVLEKTMTSMIPDQVLRPRLGFVNNNNQCYFEDPFLGMLEGINFNYSTYTKMLGWGCFSSGYTDYENSTQSVLNSLNVFKGPGSINTTNEDCTNFYTKVDIPHNLYNIIHWEVSIVAK